MSLKPVLVVIPQKTLRFISGLGSTRPSVLVARRQPNSEKQCIISERHLCVSERETATSGQENSDSSHEEESTTIHAQTEVASRQQFDAPVSEEREEREGPDDAGREDDEAVESENAVSVAPSRALKHKAVEQRRKKKISEAIQQLLDILRPPSPAGKMTRTDVLEMAVDKIKSLKQENEVLKVKIDKLPQPGGETELCGELEKQINEFLTLKSQLGLIEKQRIESHDQEGKSHDLGTESRDLVQGQDQTREPLPATGTNLTPASTEVTMSSSSSNLTSSSRKNSTSCSSVAHTHTNSATSDQGNATSAVGDGQANRIVNARTTETPPTISTHQPWPVTSILSQESASHCQHTRATTNDHPVPTPNSSHPASDSFTTNVQSSVALQNMSGDVCLPPVSTGSTRSTGSMRSTYLQPHQSDSTLTMSSTNRTCLVNSAMSSGAHQRGVVAEPRRVGQNVTAHIHPRTGNGLTPHHRNHRCRSTEQQQRVITQCGYPRERQRNMEYISYTPSNQTRKRHHCSMTQDQPHTSSIVQPWVESTQRPHPLHHMMATTPRTSPQSNSLQHHQLREQRRLSAYSQCERLVPYTYPRVNHHRSSSSTFSPGSWSHDSHVITPSTGGRDIASQCRSYASPYDIHHQHITTSYSRSRVSYYDNYLTTEGHAPSSQGVGHLSSSQGAGHPSWTQYFTPPHAQQASGNSSLMSHNTQATPPCGIQPHPHASGHGSNATAVWRPYSERTRSSGFCLADILSLPASETEATPLPMEVTPPTGHHSFLVNRLLDNM